MSDRKLVFYVWLVAALGSANPKIWSVYNQCNTIEETYDFLKSGCFKNLTEIEKSRINKLTIEDAFDIINYCNEKDYYIITFDDDDYPEMLRSIFNPPIMLFYMGDISVLNRDMCISAVGARKASEYSRRATERICMELAKVGVCIVSGFALGIDSAAHQGALKGGGNTVAVLGCGFDVDYPRENAPIKKIIAKRGAVITEFFPKTNALSANFPVRNRIIAGLSAGTLVGEASPGSGSLITADYAVEQGHDVFCVPPHNIFDNSCAGVIKYLRDGAITAYSHLDIIYEYYLTYSHKISSECTEPDFYEPVSNSSVFTTGDESEKHILNKRKSVQDKSDDTSQITENRSKPEIDDEELDENQKQVIVILRNGAMHVDDICEELGNTDVSDVFSVLTELEIIGAVRALPGKRYECC